MGVRPRHGIRTGVLAMLTLGLWRATFFATLGVSPLFACSSSDGGTSNGTDAGSGGATGGTTAASGGKTSGGGAATGGIGGASAGGRVGSGGVSSSGGADAGNDGGSSVCKNPTPRLGPDGKPTGFVDCAAGFSHRPEKRTCASNLPRSVACASGNVNDAGLHDGECAKDSDCKASPDGYCQASTFGTITSCGCNYGCTKDEDCGTGEICGCGNPVGQCVPAVCTTDAECGAGLLCMTVKQGCGYTFACQKANDTCVTDADCAGDAGYRSCEFVTDHRECAVRRPCGTGRPFLVGGTARVASLAGGTAWQSSLRPSLAGLNDAERSLAAVRWTEIALMEHASIAAFARFALDLMALGAPSELLVATHEAMADETIHAKDAFALASAYAGQSLAPGGFDMQHALNDSLPLDVLRTAILEGCIGETVAAVEAAEALAHAADPAVRAALSRVSPDETKHAELAWKFVRWALESGPETLREVAARELLATVRAERRASEARAAERKKSPGWPLLAHGILDDASRLELKRRVLVEVIEPCAVALVQTTRAVQTSVEVARVS